MPNGAALDNGKQTEITIFGQRECDYLLLYRNITLTIIKSAYIKPASTTVIKNAIH